MPALPPRDRVGGFPACDPRPVDSQHRGRSHVDKNRRLFIESAVGLAALAAAPVGISSALAGSPKTPAPSCILYDTRFPLARDSAYALSGGRQLHAISGDVTDFAH